MKDKKRTLISETIEKIDQEVLIKGWVRIRRDHGKLIFLDIEDRSTKIQVVVNPKVSEKAYKISQELRPEDAVVIIGKINKRPATAVNKDLITGIVEMEATNIEILTQSEILPFDMGGKDLHLELPTLLDYRTLTLRHEKIKAIFRVQETIVQTFRQTLKKEDFTEIFVPTIVPTATEGGSEVFQIDYYDRKAYLGQSPQFYKQMMVGVFERVFTVAHAYRAEPSVTTRHMSEYVSLDAEFGFIDSWTEIMDMVEKVITAVLKAVKDNNKRELLLLNVEVPQITNKIPRIKMRDAQEIVFKRTGRDHRKEPDLDPMDEKEICNWAQEEYGLPFVFITHYPTKKRPFYTMPDSQDPEYTLGFDLLGVQEEWVTGGQRINNYQMLLSHVEEWGNKPENFSMYLQAFKYSMPPEGGFAIGLERLTKDILQIPNVREASLFPRDMERVDERFSIKDAAHKKSE